MKVPRKWTVILGCCVFYVQLKHTHRKPSEQTSRGAVKNPGPFASSSQTDRSSTIELILTALFITIHGATKRVLLTIVMFNIDCQLERIYNHYGNKPLSMSIREFLEWIEMERPTPKHEQYSATIFRSRLNKKEKRWVWVSLSPCFLAVEATATRSRFHDRLF